MKIKQFKYVNAEKKYIFLSIKMYKEVVKIWWINIWNCPIVFGKKVFNNNIIDNGEFHQKYNILPHLAIDIKIP